MRWTLAVLLVTLVPGCVVEHDGATAWRPSTVDGGPQKQPDGTFQFVDVTGSIREVGAEPISVDCDMSPPTAHVDIGSRRLVLPDERLRQWRPNATLVVRDTVYALEHSSCNGPGLTAPGELRFWGFDSVTGLVLHVMALQGGPAVGTYVLEAGVPYHHRVEWSEPDLYTGETRRFVLDATFLYDGTWSWSDARASTAVDEAVLDTWA